MNRKFNVTCDSSSDAGIAKLKELDVDFISYIFSEGEKKYVDKMEEEQNLWYLNKMRGGSVFKTSQLNEYQYEQFFLKEGKKGLPIIHVSLCVGLSNSVTNARIAAKLVEKEGVEVHVVDATVASLAILMITKYACDLRDQGYEAKDATKLCEEKAKTVHTYYTTDTLTYFARGGRLSKGAALIANVLHINIILKCDNIGKLVVAYKIRGRKNAFSKLIELIKEEVINPEEQTLYVLHGDNLEGAKVLLDDLLKEVPFKNYETFLMGPTIGAHAGPGLIALFYYGKNKE